MTVTDILLVISLAFNLFTVVAIGVLAVTFLQLSSNIRNAVASRESQKPNIVREPVDTKLNPPPAMKPLPLDSRMPPKIVTYNPKKDQEPPVCDCHQKPIRPGQRVVLWPVPAPADEEPGSLGFWVRCQDGGIKAEQ